MSSNLWLFTINHTNHLIAVSSVVMVNSFHVFLLILFLLVNTCFLTLGLMMEDVRDLTKEVAPDEPMVEPNVITGRFPLTVVQFLFH